MSAGVTGLYAGTGQVLRLRGSGTYSGVTGGTTTLVLEVFEVPAAIISAGGLTATSSTGYNAVAVANAITLTNAVGAFSITVDFSLDSAGNLNGAFSVWASDGTAQASTKISGVTGLVGEADLNFVLAATLGGAEPSTSVLTLDEFALDAV